MQHFMLITLQYAPVWLVVHHQKAEEYKNYISYPFNIISNVRDQLYAIHSQTVQIYAVISHMHDSGRKKHFS